jgi:hypothetical protein
MAMHRLTLPFSPGNLYPTTWLLSPTHPTFLFPRLKIKLKGFHFHTTEVTEAELQEMLNILTGCIQEIAETLGTVHKC